MKYSPSTGCFYPDDIHYSNLPGDHIEASLVDFNAAMNRSPGETLDVQDGKMVIVPAPSPLPVYVPPKLAGVEFQGVMCSATAEDQNGLAAVFATWQLQGDDFQPTLFRFANRNTLRIDKGNIREFMKTWTAFRQGFFAVT